MYVRDTRKHSEEATLNDLLKVLTTYILTSLYSNTIILEER